MAARSGLVVTLASISAVAAASGLAGAATPDANPTATPTSAAAQIANHVDTYRDLGVAVLLALVTAAALVLVPYVLYRIVKLRRSPQLVMADFPEPGSDPGMSGLSELARQELLNQLELLNARVQTNIRRAKLVSSYLVKAPLPPRATPDQSISGLTDSVSGILGDPGAPYVKALTGVLLRAKGTKVTPSLQQWAITPPRIGIVFSLADLSDEKAPVDVSLWNRSDPYATGSSSPTALPEPPAAGASAATAKFTLGQIYEGAGDLKGAKAKYEEALELEPTYAPAREALAPLIAVTDMPLTARYTKMLPAACRLLAMELFERTLIADQNRRFFLRIPPSELIRRGVGAARRSRRAQNEGLILNYMGLLLQGAAEAPRFRDYTADYYDRAIRKFQAATQLTPSYYQPRENLADTLVQKVKSTASTGNEGRLVLSDQQLRRDMQDALLEYDTAKIFLTDRPHLDSAEAELMVDVDRATTVLCLDPPAVKRRLEDAVRLLDRLAKLRWNPAEERNARLLYNVACWCDRASLWRTDEELRVPGGADPEPPRSDLLNRLPSSQDLLTLGRICVGCSIARDYRREFSAGIKGDPDLKAVVGDRNAWDLFRGVEAMRRGNPCMHQLGATEFVPLVREALIEAGWL